MACEFDAFKCYFDNWKFYPSLSFNFNIKVVFPFHVHEKNHTSIETFTFTHEDRTGYLWLWSSHKKIVLPPK